MSTEGNKAIVRRYLEGIFSQGNPDVVDELAAPILSSTILPARHGKRMPKASRNR